MQSLLSALSNSRWHQCLGVTLFVLVSSTSLLLVASVASSATLNLAGGQLLGASNVDVGGTLYDVEFVDETCVVLFDGCDSEEDFEFQSEDDALLASQALMEQVFVDSELGLFDTDPELAAGCHFPEQCVIYTPFTLTRSPFSNRILDVLSAIYRNESGVEDSVAASFDLSPQGEVGFLGSVYAKWSVGTVVPEPSTALLMGLGLAALTRVRRA